MDRFYGPGPAHTCAFCGKDLSNPISAEPHECRKTRRDDYRGNPLIVLPIGENRDFSFGVGKAKAIVRFLDDIKKFIADYEPRYASHDAHAIAVGLGEDKL